MPERSQRTNVLDVDPEPGKLPFRSEMKPTMLSSLYQLKVIDVVVEMVPVFVMDLEAIRDGAMMSLPNLDMQGAYTAFPMIPARPEVMPMGR